MASVLVPVRNDAPAYSMRVDLSSVEFLLTFKFNERDSAWFLSVFDSLGAAIVEGVKVTLGIPLLRGIADARRPAGDLIAVDTTNAHAEAEALADLGDRVLLVYSEAS